MQRFRITFLCLFILLQSCTQEESFQNTAEVKTYTLKQELFSPILELSGSIEANKETPVAAKISGRIASLNADVGDFVISNTLLGTLAGDEPAASVQTAKLNEENIQNAYNSQKAFLDKQVDNALKSLELSRTNLQAVETSGSDTQFTVNEREKLAEENVKQAEVSLENIENIAEQKRDSIYRNAPSALRAAVITLVNANNFSDDILGVSDSKRHLNDDYEENLASFQSELKEHAKQSLITSIQQKKIFKKIYDEEIENKNPNRESLKLYLQNAEESLEMTQVMLNSLYSALDKSSTGNTLSPEKLEELKSKTIEHGQNIEKALLSISANTKLGVKGILLSIDEIETENIANIANARSELLKAKQSLNEIQASGKQNISGKKSQKEIMKKQLEQAELALESSKLKRESALKELQTQIDLVKGNKRLSQLAFKNTHIGAPFTGIISEKFGEIGQVVASGQAIFSIADTSLYKVKTDIPDTYIHKMQLGLEAEISIDGIPQTYRAKLSKISPKIDSQTKKLHIEFILDDKPQNTKIGMFTRIKLKLPEQESYFAPYEFIHRSAKGPYIIKDSKEKVFVDVGSEKDGMIKIWFQGEMEGIVIIE